MNKILKIIIIITVIVGIFSVGYKMPFWRQKPLPPPMPIEDLKTLTYGAESYIKDGILFTTVAVVPIACITKITRDGDFSVLIEYRYSKYHSGALIMSYLEYKRLFEVTDAKT
jgi:hypothetical protein